MDDFDLAVGAYRRRKPRDHTDNWVPAVVIGVLLAGAVLCAFLPY